MELSEYTPEMLSILGAAPDCIKPSILHAVTHSDCKANLACFCRDDQFLAELVKAILRKCNRADQDTTLHLAQGFCIDVLPSLNESRQTEIIAILVVMMIASTVSVILRFLARRVSATKYGLDDLCILFALFFTQCMNVSELTGLRNGFGKHQLMLSLHQMKMFLLNDWVTQLIFSFSITATRLSLLLFYHRIFPSQNFKNVAVLTGCFCVAWWISFVFAVIFSCVPVHAFWDRGVDGKCINENTFSYGITGSELATNIAMLILPVPWLWKLHLPTSKKFALGGIFMLGSFVCIASVVRFPLLLQLRQTDASWTIVPTGMWAVVESNIGIASVCLPIMRPLFTNHVAHPVRSRFSAFSFSISKGTSRGTERISNDSLKNDTSVTAQKPPPIYKSFRPNQDPSAQQEMVDSESRDRWSLYWNEPWGRNIGAADPADDLQPWGQNIGSPERPRDWELEIIPIGTPKLGPQTDGRVEKWDVP